MSAELIQISRGLVKKLARLEFAEPITHVYNPLDYAREPHELYLERFGNKHPEAVLLGMNPGPFGMAQTGVPFGEVALVRDWIGVSGKVKKPNNEHPKRPILGFDCPRSEVSGARLWGWAKEEFGTPEKFFEKFFILNYCPLVFMEESGKNRTPDKCTKEEREKLYKICDDALRKAIAWLEPKWVIGVGNFAETRAKDVLEGLETSVPFQIGRVLHPSPQSPAANRGWADAVQKDFAKIGISLPGGPALN